MAKQGVILSPRRSELVNELLDRLAYLFPQQQGAAGIVRDEPRLWLPCRPENEAVGTTPAYAVIQLVDAVNDEKGGFYFTYRKPDANNLQAVAIFDNFAVPASVGGQAGKGRCTIEPWYALYDTADTPALEESWGTQAGQWTLKQGNSGFKIFGATKTSPDRVFVRRTESSDEGQARHIEFELDEAIATSDDSADATVLNYWHGSDPGATVTVWNKDLGGGSYMYSGTSGTRGDAVWDDRASKYRIVQLHCG